MKVKASYIILLIMLATIYATSASKKVQACDYEPPNVEILSPENKTYAANSIPLIFTLSETTSWIGYSLDEHENSTVLGNDTLTSLVDGAHNVVVYANDTRGNMGMSNTVYFTVDTTPPNVTNVSQSPLPNNVLPDDEVKVNATVIDILSEVRQVILIYTNGNGTWVFVYMTSLEGDVWNGTIPKFDYCTWMNYTFSAKDGVGNWNTHEEIYGYQYQYHVIPEFSLLIILSLFMTLSLLATATYRRRYVERL